MAPLPKPRGQTRRRNADQPNWKQLPAAGRTGKAPQLPTREWLESTTAWWKTLWSSPMAAAWLDADVDALVRLATLRDDFARGDAPATCLPAMQALEDRFGLSPKARRALQWEVAQAKEPGADSHLAAVIPISIQDPRGAKSA